MRQVPIPSAGIVAREGNATRGIDRGMRRIGRRWWPRQHTGTSRARRSGL